MILEILFEREEKCNGGSLKGIGEISETHGNLEMGSEIYKSWYLESANINCAFWAPEPEWIGFLVSFNEEVQGKEIRTLGNLKACEKERESMVGKQSLHQVAIA